MVLPYTLPTFHPPLEANDLLTFLRADNRALTEALARADGVATLFVLPDAGVAHGPGAASRACPK